MGNINKLTKEAFISSYNERIKRAVEKLIRAFNTVHHKFYSIRGNGINLKPEELQLLIEKKLRKYDKEVIDFVSARVFDAGHTKGEENLSIDAIADLAMQIQDKYNTDPRQLIKAMEEGADFAEHEVYNPEYDKGSNNFKLKDCVKKKSFWIFVGIILLFFAGVVIYAWHRPLPPGYCGMMINCEDELRR